MNYENILQKIQLNVNDKKLESEYESKESYNK